MTLRLRLDDAEETTTPVGCNPLTLSSIIDIGPTLDDLFQERHVNHQSRDQFSDDCPTSSATSRTSSSLSSSSGSTCCTTPESCSSFATQTITRTNVASVLKARRLEFVHVAHRHGYKGFPIISISGRLIAYETVQRT
jgi:hypothetical protein